MPYQRPSFDEVKQRILADLAAFPAVLAQAFSAVLAQADYAQHLHMDWLHKQCSPLSCDLERLADWAFLYAVPQLMAVAAQGIVIATGTTNTDILVGTLLRAANGFDYRVVTAATLNGPTQIFIKCDTPGSKGNLIAGQVVSLIDPIAGCNSVMSVGELGITGGADDEQVENWRLRVIEEWRAVTVYGGRNGKASDYRFWAKSAHPSVSAVLVQPLAMGPGTVIVRPICNSLTNRLPTAEVLLALRNKLFLSAPAAADWYLAAPVVRLCHFSITLAPAVDSELLRADVVASLKNAILKLQEEQAILSLAKIDAAILVVTDQYTRNLPLADFVALPGEVLVFDGVEF